MSNIEPILKKLRTSFGIFQLTITDNNSESILFSIGGKNKCVQIKIPNIENPESGELLWLETEKGGCELRDITIKGALTRNMVLLILTYIKKKYPSIKIITLLDDSKLHCYLPDERKVTYSMMYHNIAFHQKTYYERMYNAIHVVDSEKNEYDNLITNFDNPEKKPKQFSFNNPSLTEILKPIWDSTNTWKEFFIQIERQFGDKKCSIVYPWIKFAIYNIFENKTIGQSWFFRADTLDNIDYDEINIRGGTQKKKRKTRKARTNIFEYMNGNDTELSYDEIYKIRYT
jgi:hypothetical protein